MLEALERYFPAEATWSRPEGGLFCWATLPDYIDTTDLLAKALRENVAFVPGAAAYVDGRGGSSMRLNFSASERGRDPRGDPADRRRDRRAGRALRDRSPASTNVPPASSGFAPGGGRVRPRVRWSRFGAASRMKVAVLKGGRGLERQVSLRSGARVEDALARARPRGASRSTPAPTWSRRCKAERPDVAFIALHGAGGEDGTVQELLEILAHPVHRARRARLHALDRQGRRQARAARRRDADPRLGRVQRPRLPRARRRRRARGDRGRTLGFPLVIKPAAGGSSLGVRFAAGAEEVPEALVAAFSYDDRVLLERHVEGRELAVSLLNGIALPAVEARPREEDRFNYEARYEIGRTEYVCPADLGAAEGPVLDAALRTWDVLGFDGFGRVDMILGDDGPQVLEANAIPGLTDTSLLPMAAEAAGMSLRAALRAAARARARARRRRRAAGN